MLIRARFLPLSLNTGMLRKEDMQKKPERDRILATNLKALSEDPDWWSLVQLDKTNQWIPIRINNYIDDMMIHLN
jgi:hypothetical protein